MRRTHVPRVVTAWLALAGAALVADGQPTSAGELERALAALHDPAPVAGTRLAAVAALERLAATRPADESTIAARYALARHAQHRPESPDPLEALTRYRSLFNDHPAAPLAQQALIKAALLALYVVPAGPPETRSAFSEYEALAGQLTDAAAQAQLHLLLAEAAHRFELGRAVRRRHLAAAIAVAALRPPTLADACLELAELARADRDHTAARAGYERFLALAPRDYRTSEVRSRLARLPP